MEKGLKFSSSAKKALSNSLYCQLPKGKFGKTNAMK